MLIWIHGLTCYMNNKGTQIDVIVNKWWSSTRAPHQPRSGNPKLNVNSSCSID